MGQADRSHDYQSQQEKEKLFYAKQRPTKTDLQDTLDQIQSILQDAYQPESDRETMAAAIGDALDALAGPEEDLDDEDLEEEDDDLD